MEHRAQVTSTRSVQRTRSAGLLLVAALVLLALGAYALVPRARGESPAAAVVRNGAKVVTVPIEGMSCAACAARVKKALRSVPGVTTVEVRLGERNARVEYQPGQVTPDKLVSEINKLGYRAGKPTPGG